MRHVVCREFGPPEQLAVETVPDPEPGPGEVVVAVEAAAVAFVDGLLVQGLYQVRPPLPFVPGSAAAGRVAAVGPGVRTGVDTVAPGDPAVLLLTAGGGWASHVRAPAAAVTPLPAGVDPALAATAVENYSTMCFAVGRRVTVAPGEWVLVLGAGGGIGLAAVDVARAAGGRVLAAASSEEKRAAALAAGAEEAIGYADLRDRVRQLTGGGADVVVDPVGGDLAEPALRSLAAGGRYCVLGFAGGQVPRLPANRVLLRNRTLVGVDWGDWARTRPAEAHALVAEVLGRVARGELHPPRPATLPLGAASDALRRLAARDVVGRLALVP